MVRPGTDLGYSRSVRRISFLSGDSFDSTFHPDLWFLTCWSRSYLLGWAAKFEWDHTFMTYSILYKHTQQSFKIALINFADREQRTQPADISSLSPGISTISEGFAVLTQFALRFHAQHQSSPHGSQRATPLRFERNGMAEGSGNISTYCEDISSTLQINQTISTFVYAGWWVDNGQLWLRSLAWKYLPLLWSNQMIRPGTYLGYNLSVTRISFPSGDLFGSTFYPELW
jgi:hypothetical protein